MTSAHVHRETKHLPTTRSSGPQMVQWIKSDYFCAACGKQDMWQEVDDWDDYYLGRSVACHSCKFVMYLEDEVLP